MTYPNEATKNVLVIAAEDLVACARIPILKNHAELGLEIDRDQARLQLSGLEVLRHRQRMNVLGVGQLPDRAGKIAQMDLDVRLGAISPEAVCAEVVVT